MSGVIDATAATVTAGKGAGAALTEPVPSMSRKSAWDSKEWRSCFARKGPIRGEHKISGERKISRERRVRGT
ncbi:hypothetical protein YPSE1_06830 [Yersinia pseudotuberculosis]|nr:hypothetical protein YPSE1_06830 [Yersinia pseudotuberculosis]